VSEILIVGYGNLLRGDDAIGCHAAHALEETFRGDPEVEVVASQQLTPEMADDVARCGFVVFLDAAEGGPAGTIRQAAVFPEPGPGGFSHTLTPSALLSAAAQLYGDAPPAMIISMTGGSFELGNYLSPEVRQRLPEMVRQVNEAVKSHRGGTRSERLVRTR